MADSFADHSILIPGPSFHVDLAPLDGLHPIHYSRRLLIFRCKSHAQRNAQLSTLTAGLQSLIVRCPILGGTIVPLPTHETKPGLENWRTIVPGQGLELVVRDLRTKLPSFDELEAEDFPPLKLPYDLFVPVPEDLGNDRPFPSCKVQLSAIEGGIIITWSMSHSVADGSGNNELFRLLSEEIQSAQETPKEDATTPETTAKHIGEDRNLLRSITSEKAFIIEDHPAFRSKTTSALLPTVEPKPHPFEAASPEIPILLRISPSGLAQLKKDATTPDAPPISTHDSLSALIWRTMLITRSKRSLPTPSLPNPAKSSIFLPSDARRHLNLPSSYMGNAVYQLTATIDLDALLSPSGLQQAASSLRRAITAVTPELVASYMSELKETWIEWGFMSMTPADVAMGTDWTSGSIYGDDWGDAFGKVVRFRYPGGVGVPFCCIMPKLADGSAEVIVGCMPSEVEALKGLDCFGKYLKA